MRYAIVHTNNFCVYKEHKAVTFALIQNGKVEKILKWRGTQNLEYEEKHMSVSEITAALKWSKQGIYQVLTFG